MVPNSVAGYWPLAKLDPDPSVRWLVENAAEVEVAGKDACHERPDWRIVMRAYHALCSDCPKCEKENIVFLAYTPHKKGVNLLNLNRVVCSHCFQEYHQSTRDMVLRPKTQQEIDAAAGERMLTWI